MSTGRRFAVVTTCHPPAWEAYGRAMIESFDRHWPADVALLFYPEAFDPGPLPPRAQVRELLSSCPELVAFKARHAHHRAAHGAQRRPRLKVRWRKMRVRFHWGWGLGFKWDAVRFSHKSFAILHAAAHTDADVLVWVDADTRFFADVTPAMLESFAPPEHFAGCLRRSFMWTETGFVAYNLRHPATARFLSRYRALYVDDGLFGCKQYHDAWLFDEVRETLEAEGDRVYDIAEGVGRHAQHVLVNSRLGTFMDHLKGDRKVTGKARKGDLVVRREEDYWTRKGGGPS